jgi:RNA polymerase sigma factor (sigma-70 family)
VDGSRFVSTRWSLVQLAGGGNTPEGREALEELCSRYWHPLYSYLRRSGHAPAEAADLVQGLFVSLIGRESIGRVDRDMGRFRSWLLGALNHHVIDVHNHEQTLKCGGGHAIVSIDLDQAELRYEALPPSDETPEDAFDREWAQTVMDRAFESLGEEYARRGQAALHQALQAALLAEGEDIDRARLAAQLEMEPGALRVALHRMRKRLRDHIESEVCETLGPEVGVQAEIEDLFDALGPRG